MNRRKLVQGLFVLGATTLVTCASPGTSQGVEVRVRPRVRRWINRHRRYLHHHLPRR